MKPKSGRVAMLSKFVLAILAAISVQPTAAQATPLVSRPTTASEPARGWGALAALPSTHWWSKSSDEAVSFRWSTLGIAMQIDIDGFWGRRLISLRAGAGAVLSATVEYRDFGISTPADVTFVSDGFAITGGGDRWTCRVQAKVLQCHSEASLDGRNWMVERREVFDARAADWIEGSRRSFKTRFPLPPTNSVDRAYGSFPESDARYRKSDLYKKILISGSRREQAVVVAEKSDRIPPVYRAYRQSEGFRARVFAGTIENPSRHILTEPVIVRQGGQLQIVGDGGTQIYTLSPDRQKLLIRQGVGTGSNWRETGVREIATLVEPKPDAAFAVFSALDGRIWRRGPEHLESFDWFNGQMVRTLFQQPAADMEYRVTQRCVIHRTGADTFDCIGTAYGGEPLRINYKGVTHDGYESAANTYRYVLKAGAIAPVAIRLDSGTPSDLMIPISWADAVKAMQFGRDASRRRGQVHMAARRARTKATLQDQARAQEAARRAAATPSFADYTIILPDGKPFTVTAQSQQQRYDTQNYMAAEAARTSSGRSSGASSNSRTPAQRDRASEESYARQVALDAQVQASRDQEARAFANSSGANPGVGLPSGAAASGGVKTGGIVVREDTSQRDIAAEQRKRDAEIAAQRANDRAKVAELEAQAARESATYEKESAERARRAREACGLSADAKVTCQ